MFSIVAYYSFLFSDFWKNYKKETDVSFCLLQCWCWCTALAAATITQKLLFAKFNRKVVCGPRKKSLGFGGNQDHVTLQLEWGLRLAGHCRTVRERIRVNWHLCLSLCLSLSVSVSLSLSVCLHFNGHFPGEPGLAGVHWSKGRWRRWWQVDYWSYKSCKAPVKSSPPTNQHPVLLQAGCSSCRPTNSVKALKGKLAFVS